jgi:hypothetical protein
MASARCPRGTAEYSERGRGALRNSGRTTEKDGEVACPCIYGRAGGYGTMGQNRRVFYSNTAAPLVEELLHTSRETIREDVRALQDDRDIRRASSDEHVARRYHQLLDLAEE